MEVMSSRIEQEISASYHNSVHVAYRSGSVSQASHHIDLHDEDTPLLQSTLPSPAVVSSSMTPSSNMSMSTRSPQQHPSSNSDFEHCHSLASETSNDEVSRVNIVAQKRLLIAIGLTTLFVTGEIIGGVMSNSLAILGDAAHMSSDLASFIIGLIALKLSGKPPKKHYNFGYHRAEALGALLTVVLIWYLTSFLLYEAVNRLVHKDFEVDPIPMMVVAIAAVCFNILLFFVLNGHGHSHGGEAHGGHARLVEDDEADRPVSTLRSLLNIRAAVIHVLGDFIQSLGVLVSSIIIKINPDLKIADPICTILFGVIVGFTTLRIFRDTVHILMEGVPKGVSYEMLQQELLDIQGVIKVHDLRIWALTSDRAAASCHLVIQEGGVSAEAVLQKANKLLRAKYAVQVATIQVEQDKPASMAGCQQCKPIA